MKPWGVIHNGCCGLCGFKKRTRNKITKCVDVNDTEDLEQRIMALETFKNVMENNVVDISLLKTK